MMHKAMRNRPSIAMLLLLLGAACASAGASQSGESLPAKFKRVGPAVVIVRTSGRDVPPTSGGRPVSVAGLGSGVLVDTAGRVVTAAHVVDGTCESVNVERPGETCSDRDVVRRPWTFKLVNEPEPRLRKRKRQTLWPFRPHQQ